MCVCVCVSVRLYAKDRVKRKGALIGLNSLCIAFQKLFHSSFPYLLFCSVPRRFLDDMKQVERVLRKRDGERNVHTYHTMQHKLSETMCAFR